MSNSNWWFLDLGLVIVLTGTVVFGLFAGVSGIARILLTLPLVVFLPGYALVAIFFPDEPKEGYRKFDEEKTGLRNPLLLSRGLEPVERYVLSVTFSVALVPLVALISTVTPRGIAGETVLSGLGALTVAFALLAIVRRLRCSPERRYSPSLPSPLFAQSQPGVYTSTNPRTYNVAIAIGLCLLLASGGFALASPPQSDGFTEFSIETETVTGDIETMYETTYDHGEPQQLTVTITNHEHEDRSYTVVALLERVEDENDPTIEEREEMIRESATVQDGSSHDQPLEITPTMQGDDLQLTLLLYEDDPPEEPTAENAYRSIRLPIEVR